MKILHGIEDLQGEVPSQGCVATIGVFDGVHLGHFHVLTEVVSRAQACQLTSVMVTFAGHPKSTLLGHAPPTITSLEHRLVLFERAGIQLTLVLDFTLQLKELTAENFIQTLLLDRLHLKELVFGFDSKFGRDRGGTPESLQNLAREKGFRITEVPPLQVEHRPASSTAVREAVQLGDLIQASKILGRPASVLGSVIHGDKRGRKIGFPTANINPHHELRPPKGVYAAFVWRQGKLHAATVNIGNRPTFEGDDILIEAHFLDFEEDIYGEVLEVFFLQSIRGEQTFPDAKALSQQIQVDIQQTRKICADASKYWAIPGEILPIELPNCYSFAPCWADSSVGRAKD